MKMTIKADCTDAELNEAVAHVADLQGLHRLGNGWVYFKSNLVEDQMAIPIPPYATSADAVLPLAETYTFEVWNFSPGYEITIRHGHSRFVARTTTLARGLCFVLLKAHGVDVTES